MTGESERPSQHAPSGHRANRTLAALAITVAALVAVVQAGAVQPPNRNDPCAKAGRDSCGTTGIGFYKTYQYGLRWFGDYKDVIPGAGRAFCIDLGYWYPSAEDKYVLADTPGLSSTSGRPISLLDREKLAYAIWQYGRSTDPDRQAAVMLYVHSLMGDARPGEIDPAAIGATVQTLNRQVAAAAARFHGPYRIESTVSGPLRAGQAAEATVKVVSGSGAALPNVTLSLTVAGASGARSSITTDAQGVGHLTFRPTAAQGVTISVRTEPLASTLPTVYHPTTAAAAHNAQRIAMPASQQVSRTIAGHVVKGHIAVTTAAKPAQQIAGHVVRDHVTITGATASWHAKVTAVIHGPFPSAAETACGKAAWTGTFAADGSGTYVTPVAAVTRPGWYVFQLRVPGDSGNVGVRTGCDDSAERFFVQAAPTLATTASAPTVAPGTPLFDRITVGSLAGESVTAVVDLFGPFSSTRAIACDGTPIWSGSVAAKANGSYKTATFSPTVPGIYAYRARVDSSDLIRGTQNTCGEQPETTVVSASPKVVTEVSTAQAKAGGQISDEVDVSGSGAFHLKIVVELFGPFDSPSGIRCTVPAIWTGSVASNGDGGYRTKPVTLDRVGYYVFRESIAATDQSAAFTGKCSEAAETTVVASQPEVTTLVSDDVVRPGTGLTDHIRVSGLGKTEAAIQVQLYGPFSTREAIRCTGKPYWETRVTAQGDGVLTSPPARIEKAGFYVFHETLVGRPHVSSASTDCADSAETSLGAPAIITGRGDRTHLIATDATTPNAPVRITVSSLGIDAPVVAAGIDVKAGILAVPADIHKTGWWSDGAAPGDATGSVVIAGHVDSATAGAGAFFPLKQARRGTLIQVATAGGGTKTYRVVSVQTMLKAQLPTSIWSQKGKNRLVVVTCGGPFDQATGHYRDNVVVTAVPA
ncbi:MAG TPA: sortase [Gaiellaceae bacterium]